MGTMKLRRRFFTLLALVPLASVAIYGGACGHSDDVSFEVDRVLYEGETSDEPLLTLLASKDSAEEGKGVVFDAPAVTEPLWAWTPPTFEWHVAGATSEVAPAAPAPRRHASGSGLFGPIRAAHAHGAPLNGQAYFLVFSSPTQSLLGVFTTKLEYTPSQEDWTLLGEAAQPITVNVLSGIFSDSELAEGGGPFLGTPLTFSIAAQ
ncbi:Hypothetical protein A7982_08327 [Minicystis rosea]|nr:Hypothetical protein A7982_08327 [Minicystis rosea]